MKILSLFLVSWWLIHDLKAQNPYADFTETIQKLSQAKDEELDALWDKLVSENKIPLTCEDSVAFLYRGEAGAVAWVGDFNGWGYIKGFDNKGTRISKTDLWILRASVPKDARLDYKILLDNNQSILDPFNLALQWSGVAGGSLNSELHMPYWRKDTLTSERLAAAPPGKLGKEILVNSRELGYQMTYNLYFPHDYQKDKRYPILYVTDGYEYMHERMGNMLSILDNLIYLGKIRPVVAVFIDHREPVNRSSNRRMMELSMNKRYLNFFTRELIPDVEKNVKAADYPASRIIIGNSAGGLFGTWLAFSRPDLFPLAGVQSPSFSFQPQIFGFCENAPAQPVKIFMTSGLIHDNEEGPRKMNDIFQRKSSDCHFIQVNEGHSWGNWRDLTDDMLVYLLN